MTVLEAIRSLRNGRDVLVIAHPADRAFEIADAVLETAQSAAIPCVLSERRDGAERYETDVPLILVRPFGWPAEFTPSFRARPVVLVDQSAVFERCNYRPCAFRTVDTEGL